MANTQITTVYGRTVKLPAVESLSLPSAADAQPVLTVSFGTGHGQPHNHDTGMRIWTDQDSAVVEVPASYGPLASEHLLLDHAVPIALSSQGDTVIHGAGFERDGIGALLVGESGQGKSVTSQYLESEGWRLLSDDAVRVEIDESRVVMWPSYNGVRLFEEALELLGHSDGAGELVAEYGTKRRLSSSTAFSTEPAELRVVFVLGGTSESPGCRSVGPAKLLSVLAESAFNVTIDVSRATERLRDVAPFVEHLAGYELTFERRPESLPVLAQIISETMADHGS